MITVTVRDIVQPNIISLDKRKTVKDAAVLMVEHDIGSVVATNSGEPIGIVTERDILKKVTYHSKDPGSVTVEEIMTSPPITIDANASLGDATLVMIEKKIRRLLATDNGKIIGIFTQRDLQDKVLDVFMSLRNI
jgi:CBS domain-containing protein